MFGGMMLLLLIVMLALLPSSGSISILAVAGGVSANPLLGLLGSVVLLSGTTAFGVVVVRSGVLSHARLGGILLAVSLPFAFALGAITSVLNLSLPVLLPFSLAWFLLGLDVFTGDSGGVDMTIIREPE